MKRGFHRKGRRTGRWFPPFVFLFALAFFLASCSSEEEKKPKVSANLCLYIPNGMVLGPYDTQKACTTARENIPQAECKPCKEKAGGGAEKKK